MGEAGNLYAEVLQFLVARLRADRALVLEGETQLKVKACHGLDPTMIFSGAPLSLSLLGEVRKRGQPLLLGDARHSDFRDSFSLMVSGIRSVLCVPFWGPSGCVQGLLYADSCSKTGLFSRKDLDLAVQCARRLEAKLFRGDRAPLLQGMSEPASGSPAVAAPKKPAPLARQAPLKPAVLQAPRRADPADAAALARFRPRGDALVAYMRCLAATVTAGLPLSRALRVLGGFEDEPGLAQISLHLEGHLQSGRTLADSMTFFPGTFSKTHVVMVRMAERSGTLHMVLNQVAAYEEKARSMSMKLSSALTYPALLLVACLVLILLVPPYLLDSQFQLIKGSGQPIPWITQVLMSLSSAMKHSPFWIGLTLLVAGSIGGLKLLWAQAPWRVRLVRAALKVPVLRRILVAYSTARFAGCLSVLIKIGHPIIESIPLACSVTGSPLLQLRALESAQALREGQTVYDALKKLESLPRAFMEILKAGEESGQMSDLLAWLSRFYDQEFESCLEALVALVEPLIVMGMGIVVGILILATMLPMVHVIQAL